MSIRSACRAGGVFVLAFVAAGCARKGTVSGKVSYQGQTLDHGTVLFVSPGKKTVSCVIGSDGSYTIADIPAGTVKIGVQSKLLQKTKLTDPEAIKRARPEIPAGANLPPGAEKIYGAKQVASSQTVDVPDELADPEKSGKTLTVNGGEQQFDITLP